MEPVVVLPVLNNIYGERFLSTFILLMEGLGNRLSALHPRVARNSATHKMFTTFLK